MANYNDYIKYLQHVDNITKQEVTAKIDSLNEEITNLKSSLTNLNKVKDGLTDELGKANRQINEQTDRINQKEVELQIAAKKQTALENELKSTVSTKNEEIRLLQNDLENSKKKAAKSESEKQKLEKELSKTINEIDTLKGTIEKLGNTIKELEKGNSKKYRRILFILSAVIAMLIVTIILLSVPLKSNTKEETEKPTPLNIKTQIQDKVINVDNYRVGRSDGAIFTYWGVLKDNLPNGKGSALYGDGRRYEGNFADGYRHGKGKMTFPNGDVYEGDYVKDRAEGQGEMRYGTGQRYVGEWKDNNISNGVYIDVNSKKYIVKNGEIVND